MYIKKDTTNTYNMEMNQDEYKAIKTILDKLIFNPEGVSNQFRLTQQEIDVIRQMNGHLYGNRGIR